MRNAPCLRSTSVLGAERGGSVVAGCSPFGSQRTLAAPRSGWRVTGVSALSLHRSVMHSQYTHRDRPRGLPVLRRSAHQRWRLMRNQLWSRQDRRGVHAPRGLAQLCSGTYRPCSARPTLRSSGPACGRPLSSNVDMASLCQEAARVPLQIQM